MNGKPLITSEIELNTVENRKKTGLHQWLSPFVLFSLLLVIYLFTKSKVLEYIFVLSAGTIGVIMLSMWLFSEHPEVKYNLNVLWSNPLYLIYIAALKNERAKKILGYVFLATILLTVLIWITGYQNFDFGMIPLLMVLTMINVKHLDKTDIQFKKITHGAER